MHEASLVSNDPAPGRAAGAPVEAAQASQGERWEHFDHGADIGVRGYGATKAAAFEQAALALTAVIADPALVEARETVPIACESDDDELLLAAWLNAIVTEMAIRRMLFGRFRVDLRGRQLTGAAIGEPLSPLRHRPAVEVKGATYTSLRVARSPDGGWLAQTVVDV
jgi:SHS2 domain-containing protein